MILTISESELDRYIDQQLKSIPIKFEWLRSEASELIFLYSYLYSFDTSVRFSSDRNESHAPIPLVQIDIVDAGCVIYYWSQHQYSDHIIVQTTTHDESREQLRDIIQLRKQE